VPYPLAPCCVLFDSCVAVLFLSNARGYVCVRVRVSSRRARYVIINNDGEVLRKLPTMSADYARELGEEIYNLAQKARHVVRDLKPSVRFPGLLAGVPP